MENLEQEQESQRPGSKRRRGRPGGRPPTPDDERHSQYVHVLLTKQQKEELEREARSRHLTLSGYMRLQSLGLPVIEPIGEIHQLAVVQLGEIAQLLDQCLREGLTVERETLKDVNRLCLKLNEQLFSSRRRQR